MKNMRIIIILIIMAIVFICGGILIGILKIPSNSKNVKDEPKPVVVETPKLYGTTSMVGDIEFSNIRHKLVRCFFWQNYCKSRNTNN